MKRFLPILLLIGACRSGSHQSGPQDASSRIIQAALAENQGCEKRVWLYDRIGNRLSGSEHLNRAIARAAETMRRDGLSNVRTEKVMVPVWVRGEESAEIVVPAQHTMFILGLGGSVGTPPGGITADVAVVKSFDQLGDHVRGKSAVYNVPFTTYGRTVQYRVRGASEAARRGAVAALVRSVTPVSLRSPHTGMMRYEDGVAKIPAAAIPIEDAELLQRLQDRGDTPRVRLTMHAKTLPDAESANVIGEVPGETNEIVLIGGHIDSWDVGTGAHDDGAGCVIVMEAARIIARLKPIGADRIDGGGADIGPLLKDGVPNIGLLHDMSRYWDIHHTHADTLDKVDPKKLALNIAAMAVMAWELANIPGRLGE